jgi:hypothetical protein
VEIVIYFRNVALESVASVKIEDIRVTPVPRSSVVRDRPILGGAEFVRVKDGNRTVTITFGLLEQDYEKRRRDIEAITRWALSDQPAPMQLPYHQNMALDVICTGLPEPSTREWWESRLALTFTAYDPYFYSIAEKSVACGTAFLVLGDAPPKMRITRTLSESASNQAYSDGTDTMTFSTVPAGNLVIDLNRQTAAVGNTSIMQYFGLTSSFILPRVGSMTITGTGTVKWRERWKS